MRYKKNINIQVIAFLILILLIPIIFLIRSNLEPCKDNDCYLDLALKENNSQYCLKINEISERNNCYDTLARELMDEKLCNYKSIEKSYCYFRVALAKLDFTICDKITIQHKYDECYLYAAKYEKDITYCEKSGIYSDRCYGFFK
ncbi:hypothetical protein ACFL1H_07035 [Nanoarchaeota archaeon]